MIFNRPVIYGTSYKGRLYIGQHIGTGKDYVGSGLLINRVIKKGDKNKLITGVIEYVDDVNKLNEREIYWIKKLKPELNLTKGGETWGIGKDNIMYKPGVSEKVSKSLKGRRTWDNRGDNNPMRRPEVAEKVSKSLTGRKVTWIPKGRIITWGHKISEAKKRANILKRKGEVV